MDAIRSVVADYTVTEVRVPFMKDAERNIVVVKNKHAATQRMTRH